MRIHGISWLILFVAFLVMVPPSALSDQPRKEKPAKAQRLREEKRLQEAAALRRAFYTLAKCPHDYNGHRSQALHAVREAVGLLDERNVRPGIAADYDAALREQPPIRRLDELARTRRPDQERSQESDADLRHAAALLADVRSTLLVDHQEQVLAPIEKALREIRLALAPH